MITLLPLHPAGPGIMNSAVLFKTVRCQNESKAGFTLIELLVVVAIIAILASLLLPALASAKECGRIARCQGNEHQMGIALNLFLDDSGAYPMSAMRVPVQGQRLAWFDLLSPYVGKTKWGQGVFKCPSYKWGLTVPNTEDQPLGIQAGSYAYNAYGFAPVIVEYGPGDRSRGLGGSTDDLAPDNLPVKESKIKIPSDMYALGDSPALFEVNAYTHLQGGFDIFVGSPFLMTNKTLPLLCKQVIIQHVRGNNMVFLDAHVEFVPTAKLYSTAPTYWRRWNRAHWALGDPFVRGE